MKELSIQTKIVTYLRKTYPKAVVWKLADEKISGIPDILFMNDGVAYFFEVKTPVGRLTKIQEYTIKALRRAGIYANKVTSLEEVKEILCSTN